LEGLLAGLRGKQTNPHCTVFVEAARASRRMMPLCAGWGRSSSSRCTGPTGQRKDHKAHNGHKAVPGDADLRLSDRSKARLFWLLGDRRVLRDLGDPAVSAFGATVEA